MIIFAFPKRCQALARDGELRPTRGFGGVAVADFGEAGDDIIAIAQGFEGEFALIEVSVRLYAVHAFREQFEAHFARHAVRANDDGQRDGASAGQS